MVTVRRSVVSTAIAQLVPHIVGGVQSDFLAKREVTQRQFLLLLALHARPRCTVGGLAQRMQVSMPTVTGLIDRLAATGYVRRSSEPEDRRHVIIMLTAKGQDFIRRFQEAVQRRWDDVLRPLAAKELEALHQVVTALSDALQTHG